MNTNILGVLITEALKMPSNKTWVVGAVTGYDRVGTTMFVQTEDGRELLAFVDPKNPLTPGDHVTFRIDQVRAVDIRREIPAAT
jgi:hypothetical protein